MIIVDGHMDLAYNAVVLGRDLLLPVAEIRAREQVTPPPGKGAGTCMASLPTLLEGRVAVVGASLFVAPAWRTWSHEPQVYHNFDEAHAQASAQLDYYHQLAERALARVLRTAADLEAVLQAWREGHPTLGLFVVMEGADPIRTPEELDAWVARGLRGITLAWASGSHYAGGNAYPGPLTDEGKRLLLRMSGYNLMLDVSHLWMTNVYEALDLYPGPVVATHANPRAFVPDSPRLISDDVIRRLAERDGVVGIVPYNTMLEPAWREPMPRVSLERVVQAIDHVCQVVGSARHVGLGSDMDGGFGREAVPEGLDSAADLPKLADRLTARGYAPADVEAILSGNWLRVMRTVLAHFEA